MKNKRMKQVISCILAMAVVFGGFWIDYIPSNADEEKNDITLYLIDNTVEQWLEDDAAIMELVDNTNGHHAYTMTQVTAGTWSVYVPKTRN